MNSYIAGSIIECISTINNKENYNINHDQVKLMAYSEAIEYIQYRIKELEKIIQIVDKKDRVHLVKQIKTYYKKMDKIEKEDVI